MVRKPKINSLKELQQRKKELRLETELTKREFAHSIGSSRENLTDYLLKRVAAPVGGGALALFLLNKLLSSGKRPPEIVRETKVIHEYPDGHPAAAARPVVAGRKRSRLKWVATLVSLGKLLLPMAQAIIGAVTTHQAKESAEDAEHAAKRAAVN